MNQLSIEPMAKNEYIERMKTQRKWCHERGIQKFDVLKQSAMNMPHQLVDYQRLMLGYNEHTPLYGIELEIEGVSREERAKLVRAIMDKHTINAYLATDGSLNNGIEIVTAPLSEQELRASYIRFYNALKTLSQNGYTSHDSSRCGLHIHVSRKSLTQEKWLLMRDFIVKHSRYFRKLSRRKGTDAFRYCQFQSNEHERYRALNMRPQNTVELRFFRGTLLPSAFLASLETMFSLVAYFRTLRGEPDMRSYRKHIKQGKYIHLQKYLVKLGLTRTGPRRTLTDDERAARAAIRLENAERAKRGLHLEIERAIRNRTAYITSSPGTVMRTMIVKCEFQGVWPRRYRAHLANMVCTIKYLHTNVIENATIVITRRVGWGRSSCSAWLRALDRNIRLS